MTSAQRVLLSADVFRLMKPGKAQLCAIALDFDGFLYKLRSLAALW
jgi:hypothetical protein